jgi:cytochrome o ubiquinol oxidase subunit 2
MIRSVIWGVIGLGALLMVLLHGNDIALLNPKGLIAGQQMNLMLFSAGLLLTIAVPTVFLFYFFAWKYRETNEKATYDPQVRHGKWFVPTMWLLPSVFMLVLAMVMWTSTHRLEPQKPIAAKAKPITIQVVALRWKWLFIYPEQKIATVNYVQVPTDTPVEFELTADDAPMSSFWIPHWGGQLYAMTGHVNRLNLIAETAGDSVGSSAEINGSGFAGMKFTARATSKDDFDLWVRSNQLYGDALDAPAYDALAKPSEDNPQAFYSLADTGLYDKVLMKYMGSHGNMGHEAGYE